MRPYEPPARLLVASSGSNYFQPLTESRGRHGRFQMPLSPGDLRGSGLPLHDCPNPFYTASPPGHYQPPFPESRGPRDDFRCRFRPTICMAMHPRGFSKILEDSRRFSRIIEDSRGFSRNPLRKPSKTLAFYTIRNQGVHLLLSI